MHGDGSHNDATICKSAELAERATKCESAAMHVQTQHCPLSIEDIPDDCICPITQELMQDPVVAADGNSYERAAIEAWFKRGWRTGPLTNESLPHVDVIPNNSLRKVIRDLVERMSSNQREKLERVYQSRDLQKAVDDLIDCHEGFSAITSRDDISMPVDELSENACAHAYGGNFSWVGVPYRMKVRKGISPLQWLNGLTSLLLSLHDIMLTADGGFRRPGEDTPLFPRQGINLRWRWDAGANNIIIDFSSNGTVLSWRWDELRPSRECRFPSTAPDLKGIGHVGRFTFNYVMMSATAEDIDMGNANGTHRKSFFNAARSFLHSAGGGQSSLADGSRQKPEYDEERFYGALHFQIGDRCAAVSPVTMRVEQSLASEFTAEFGVGTIFDVLDLGTEPRRLKVQTDGIEGWVSFVTRHGDFLLSRPSIPLESVTQLCQVDYDEDLESLNS